MINGVNSPSLDNSGNISKLEPETSIVSPEFLSEDQKEASRNSPEENNTRYTKYEMRHTKP